MRSRIAALLAATALALAGCSADDTPTGDTAEHNEADVVFATDMIPHHAQALVMVDMTEGRDVSPEFAELAAGIKAAQTPEIEKMTGWLEGWGEDVPDSTGMHGMDMGDVDMSNGMMSDSELTGLDSAADSRFESMWLRMMIEHHEGAIEMSELEIEAGAFPPAIALATSIATSQQAEIETMKGMLEE
ncbi:Lipoprotein [metagenome]|uniref:Lipoprotein n=1 Tax=metagenome TaxID=256318 RepID=A0A2P2BZ32_9ZZZZ